MIYPSIRIEGSILSPDIIDRLEDMPGQKPGDFGLESGTKVKDEIARAWADAQDYWRIFRRKLETLKPEALATTETRNLWIVPLLGLLKYDLEYQKAAAELNSKSYAISHRVTNRSLTPVHIVGYRDPAGLDRKPVNATLRMSAHAVVQEYLNLTEQLYGVVTNGRVIRLLRDSSRLVKQSYLEFDLDRIFTDGLFADFAVLYRLLHATRLPVTTESAAECIFEKLHQDSLDSGARIREGLSKAVEAAILTFGNGYLAHPANAHLRAKIASGTLSATDYYAFLLRLIYRLLFLMVIEERGLVFPPSATQRQRETYAKFYSLQRLRDLSEKRYLADKRQSDLWLAMVSTFQLFEANGPGVKLGLKPLAGDLFRPEAIGDLNASQLGNDSLLACLRSLGLYEHPENRQLIRVNYAALNVEEFGSVYEGLLEYEPQLTVDGSRVEFSFKAGDERAATGSHYTPDELVQPLIKHSLDYLIADRLKAKDPEAALLDLRVADIACGSGHILLAAARRIATELAVVRTGEEQPSPDAFRAALRHVICTCIYGVDLNPLAVELCKVALWLEAHNPGQPLNFLDHHIKCGNAIVGFVNRDAVNKGVPDEAFAKLPDDDLDTGAELRKRNKAERKEKSQLLLDLSPEIRKQLDSILAKWKSFSSLPETTPTEIDAKRREFIAFTTGTSAFVLNQIASIPIAQFYIPKTPENIAKVTTDEQFRRYWGGSQAPQGEGPAAAVAVANRKHFFHWFLEFPEIMSRGGFDCILGNPPYLGGKKISGQYGDAVLSLLKYFYEKSEGGVDLVSYFVRRANELLHKTGYMAFITTKKICQGDTRVACLQYLLDRSNRINFANRSNRWSGRADVHVSQFSITQCSFPPGALLNGKTTAWISSFLDDGAESLPPLSLAENSGRSFQGVVALGEGFYLDSEMARQILSDSPRYAEVVKRIVNGSTLNSRPDLKSDQWIISFFDRTEAEAKTYPRCYDILRETVFETRQIQKRKQLRDRWWQFAEKRPALYSAIANNKRVLVRTQASKHNVFEYLEPQLEYDQKLIVFATEQVDVYSVLNSDLHLAWIIKFSGEVGGVTINYSPTQLFETFPFPRCDVQAEQRLVEVGKGLVGQRRELMRALWLGLTDIYNLFHFHDLAAAKVAKVSKKSATEAERGYQGLLELRRLHVELDQAVLHAYGWDAGGANNGTAGPINLAHDFYEIETLPENDRVRYTISPAARKEVLKRLLALNHERAKAESIASPAKGKKRKVVEEPQDTSGLFGEKDA